MPHPTPAETAYWESILAAEGLRPMSSVVDYSAGAKLLRSGTLVESWSDQVAWTSEHDEDTRQVAWSQVRYLPLRDQYTLHQMLHRGVTPTILGRRLGRSQPTMTTRRDRALDRLAYLHQIPEIKHIHYPQAVQDLLDLNTICEYQEGKRVRRIRVGMYVFLHLRTWNVRETAQLLGSTQPRHWHHHRKIIAMAPEPWKSALTHINGSRPAWAPTPEEVVTEDEWAELGVEIPEDTYLYARSMLELAS